MKIALFVVSLLVVWADRQKGRETESERARGRGGERWGERGE